MRRTSHNPPETPIVTKRFCNRWLRRIMETISQGNRKAVLLVLLVFGLGIGLGSVGTYVVTAHVLAAHPQQADPEYEQARQAGREKIRQVLTPDQRPKFEELLRRIDEERFRRQNEAHD